MAVASACADRPSVAEVVMEPPAARFLDIVAGPDRTCAVDEEGGVFCWGRRLFGGDPDSVAVAPVPLPTTARLVALGGDHSCALRADGGVVCWGDNRQGQCGRADDAYARLPRSVEGAPPFEGLAAGAAHTCARTADDDIWCWGGGGRGSIGSPDLSDSRVPVLLGAGWRSYAAFDVGGHHGCAVGRDEHVYCWGWNAYGQLGVGILADLGSPERVARPGPYAAVFTGDHHSCALTPDGAAWCWGRGDAGQLGHGATTGNSVPVPVAGAVRFSVLALGREHTCGLDTGGVAYCWGQNRHGRLGTGGPPTVVPQPAPVATDHRFRRITAGHRHTCAVSVDGLAYCWGHGGFGQLGTGAPVDANTPVAVLPAAP